MKINHVIAFLPLVSAVAAVKMFRYKPSVDVEAGFESYLRELYASAENPKATNTFTDFFAEKGWLLVLGNEAEGADAIVALKQKLLPADGTKSWNHLPNATTVDSETAGEKTYKVLGVIESRYKGGNCSQAYYSSRFTVAKDVSTGATKLNPHAATLLVYDDYIVSPAESPTDIACGTV